MGGASGLKPRVRHAHLPRGAPGDGRRGEDDAAVQGERGRGSARRSGCGGEGRSGGAANGRRGEGAAPHRAPAPALARKGAKAERPATAAAAASARKRPPPRSALRNQFQLVFCTCSQRASRLLRATGGWGRVKDSRAFAWRAGGGGGKLKASRYDDGGQLWHPRRAGCGPQECLPRGSGEGGSCSRRQMANRGVCVRACRRGHRQQKKMQMAGKKQTPPQPHARLQKYLCLSAKDTFHCTDFKGSR